MINDLPKNIRMNATDPTKFVGVEESTGVEWFGRLLGGSYQFRRGGDGEVFYARNLNEASQKLRSF